MGFSLFGSSGEKTTNQSTTNVTNDTTTTTANSNNLTNNTANNLNAALTNNSSYIKNDSLVQNTALQLTDSFNRINTNNLANVGNVNINGTGSSPVTDYAAFFSNAAQSKNNQTPIDLSKPLLDFNTLTTLNSSQLDALTKLSNGVQTGFAQNTAATGATVANLASGSASGAMSNTMKIILGAMALVIVYLIARRK